MPVTWAIAQSDVAHLDRFTGRCRVPLEALEARPSWAGNYVLRCPRDEPSACLCQAMLAPAEQATAAHGVFDPMVRVPPAQATRLIQQLAAERDLTADVVRVRGLSSAHGHALWIPRARVRNAAAVTLQADVTASPETSTNLQALGAWLKDVHFRQLLQETLQHQVLLCPRAVVVLPLPAALRTTGSSTTDEAQTIAWRVISTYPSEGLSRVTSSTRVTLTIESPDVDADDAERRSKGNDSSSSNDKANGLEPENHQRPMVGGLDKELEALRELILLPVTHRGLREQYGLEFPKGLLLCGPPGVGKTLLVRTAVQDCRDRVPLHLAIINGSEILTSGIGDAEQTLRGLFRRAADHARETHGASVIFIDELDALCPKRDAHGTMASSRIVAQLLTLLDGADPRLRENVIIVGATNLPNNIDPALRRPGRFDREIFVSPPDAAARREIFRVHMRDMPFQVDGSEDARRRFLEALATRALGYVGADIAALCREALSVASTRQFVELTRSHELERWWSDWRRHGRTVQVSDLERMVAGIAWRVSPVAIPVWFLQRPSLTTSTTTAAPPPSRPVEFFSYLFRSIHESQADGKDPEAPIGQEKTRATTTTTATTRPVFEVTMADFEQAMQVIVPSALRSAAGMTKNVEQLGWDRIGGQEETKLALQQALEWPIKYPETFAKLGITPPRGVLLYGPPGCSKSTIVRAAAHSSGATFLSLSAAQVFSPFFGDAEASVRQVFRDARAALPAIIFFDEIDVLVTKREFDGASAGSGAGSGSTALRVLSTLLNEMDGVESAEGLLVIGATNRPDCIDAALLRPGRFDRIVFVDLPTERDRHEILRIHTRGMTLDDDVDLPALTIATPFFSGAELENLCREAALRALRESIHADSVAMRHFVDAQRSITPVTTEESLDAYFEFAARMGGHSS